MSIVSEQFPTEWKTARVIPVFKKGRRFMLNNYRLILISIDILLVVSKLMEKVLYDQMLNLLVKENLLSEHQYGFEPFQSTTTTLFDCTNEW